MHVVTKILVVFCAILSLVLAALTMAFATNADRIRQSFEQERAFKLAVEATQRETETGFAGVKAALQVQLDNRQKAIDALNAQISTLQAERTSNRADIERSNADKDAARNQTAQLVSANQVQSELIKNMTEENGKLRDDIVSAAKRELELVDRINDLTSQREVLEQNARALKEQLEETKLALQNAQQGGSAAAAGRSEPRELAGPVVRAKVTEVVSGPTGGLVVISEGSNRGLKENIIMNITRGEGQYIGSIVLTRVEPNSAVGQVRLTAKDVQIMKDDDVLSRLN